MDKCGRNNVAVKLSLHREKSIPSSKQHCLACQHARTQLAVEQQNWFDSTTRHPTALPHPQHSGTSGMTKSRGGPHKVLRPSRDRSQMAGLMNMNDNTDLGYLWYSNEKWCNQFTWHTPENARSKLLADCVGNMRWKNTEDMHSTAKHMNKVAWPKICKYWTQNWYIPHSFSTHLFIDCKCFDILLLLAMRISPPQLTWKEPLHTAEVPA